MPKNDSTQKRLQKVRPPRVQMTYDVEVGDAIENKELPFVVGVVGDFGADPDVEKKRLKDRNFVNNDKDNFDEVLAGVALQFKQMDDFRPEAVVQQVAPLKGLLEARTKLADLRNKLAGNDKLDDILSDVLSNTDKLGSLRKATQGEGN